MRIPGTKVQGQIFSYRQRCATGSQSKDPSTIVMYHFPALLSPEVLQKVGRYHFGPKSAHQVERMAIWGKSPSGRTACLVQK